jgi:hypothetical protein
MQPEQSVSPAPGNNYDFIMSPQEAPKPKFPVPLGGNSFMLKLVFIVGGAVIVVIIAAVAVNLFFARQDNIATTLSIVQTEQELVRLGTAGKKASSQEVRNAAINTQLSVKSHQQDWLDFLAARNREVKKAELELKENASTDSKLSTAEETSTFDTTYISVMRSQLESYGNALSDTYDGTSNKKQRDLLLSHYADVKLLLEQWPAASLGLASY